VKGWEDLKVMAVDWNRVADALEGAPDDSGRLFIGTNPNEAVTGGANRTPTYILAGVIALVCAVLIAKRRALGMTTPGRWTAWALPALCLLAPMAAIGVEAFREGRAFETLLDPAIHGLRRQHARVGGISPRCSAVLCRAAVRPSDRRVRVPAPPRSRRRRLHSVAHSASHPHHRLDALRRTPRLG
jgi:hypothetical protein